MFVLGVDPGQTTGLALLEERPELIGLRLIKTAECALDLVREAILELLGRTWIDLAAIEDWEYQGPQRARGVAHQAYATGVVTGVLQGPGRRVVAVTRTRVLAAIGFRRGQRATKAAVAAWVRKLVPPITPEVGAVERSEHEWDAVAVAVAGMGVHEAARAARQECLARR